MMKARKIFIPAAIAALAAVGACHSDHYCRCVDIDETAIDTIIVNVDKGLDCKQIKQIGIERMTNTGSFEIDSVHHYYCQEIPRGDISSIDNLPY